MLLGGDPCRTSHSPTSTSTPRLRASGGADLDRQRLPLHPGCRGVGGRGRCALPGTYVHGVYNRETTILGGLPVLNEDLVNVPNWLVLKLRIEGADAIRLANVELLDYRHGLDIRNAVVRREMRFRDRAVGRRSCGAGGSSSMADVPARRDRVDADPENWSGRVEVVSAIDGRVTNQTASPATRARGPPPRPGLTADLRPGSDRVEGGDPSVEPLHRPGGPNAVRAGSAPIEVKRGLHQMDDYVQQVLSFDVREGVAARVEKLVRRSDVAGPCHQRHARKAGSRTAPVSRVR